MDYGATCYQETDITKVYPDAKVRLIRPPSLGLGRIMHGVIYNLVIYTILKSRKIDVVILYSAPTNGVQTILAAKRLGIPVIFRSIDVLHKLAPKILSLPTRLAESWVYRHAGKVLTITPALSRYVVKLGADPAKVGILPLGVDLQCHPCYPELKSSGFTDKTGIEHQTMIFAGTLPHFSGLPELIRKIPEMVAKLPGLRLLIVGNGPQRPELEKLLRELGLEERVKITGMVPHEDVPKWIAGADVGMLTFPAEGATRDIFPTKVLQYMAQGKPVIANPLPGLVDFGLGANQGIVYVRNGDWAAAIVKALANREVLGAVAKRYVRQEHGHDQIVSRLEKEMEALCKSR
jgi:glycosyltransferase involved in cell wall biosynthesis